MPNILISLREFLKTGRFGPVTLNSTLLDVAREFGGPHDFITQESLPVPTYWRYGNFEIAFDEEAPHRTPFYQIEHASELTGDCTHLKNGIVLSLEGLHGETKPSEFLMADLWDLDNVTVIIGALFDDIILNIKIENIEIVFWVLLDFPESKGAEEYLDGTSLDEIVKKIDSPTRIISIGASSTKFEGEIFKSWIRYRPSGREYLACLSQVENAPPA